MRRRFLDPFPRPQLRAAGIDGWVALLILIASTRSQECGDYFRFYVETLAAQSPPVRTYEGFRSTVDNCLWTPAINPHLRKA
ncbi:hypothetical protein DL771_003980 [Monosporascus sp. 5C6A]|nr:hypothetical protein DL771_003980 [Monosporascus sp. 5C6A]